MDLRKIINDELSKYLNQHGRLIFMNEWGDKSTVYGYIRKIGEDYIIFQDNETPHTFKVKNIKSFDIVELT